MKPKGLREFPLHHPDDILGGTGPEGKEKREKSQRFVSLLRANYNVIIPWLQNSLSATPDNIGSDNFFDLDDERRRRIKIFFEIIKETSNFLSEGEQKKHLTHDVSNKTLVGLIAHMGVIDEDFFQGNVKCNKESKRGLEIFYSVLNRWYVSVEDLLLRSIDDKEISSDNVVPMDLDKMLNVFSNFENEGIGHIFVDETERVEKGDLEPENRQYSQINSKNFFIEFSEENLKGQLAGRKVMGNDGLIDNLLLNMSRNGLKDQMEAKNVYFDAFVEGNELVLRVMDDGKGISKEYIDPSNQNCIFSHGVSGTGSSGLGLADINTRVPSAGGELRLVSQGRGEEYTTTFSTGQALSEDYLEKINQNRSADKKIKTAFEIRLKLI